MLRCCGFRTPSLQSTQEGWGLCSLPPLKAPIIFFASFVHGGSANLKRCCRHWLAILLRLPEAKAPVLVSVSVNSTSGIPKSSLCHRLFQDVCGLSQCLLW